MNMRELRDVLGLTQQEVATKIDATLGSVSKWELGKAEPKKKFLPRLAAVYGVGIDEIRKAIAESVAARDGK